MQQYNNIETGYITTSKDFYRSTTMALREEGVNDVVDDYYLTDGLSDSESVHVNSAFYGDSCDYVYSDWNQSMNLKLSSIFEHEQEESKLKGDFIITCIVTDIGEEYEVLDYTVDEMWYDEEVRSLVLQELEYDKYPDLGMSSGDIGEFKLKVSSQYTEDYYGEADVDIQVEVL